MPLWHEAVRSDQAAMLPRKRRFVLRPAKLDMLRYDELPVGQFLWLPNFVESGRNEVLQVEPGMREREVRFDEVLKT